MSLKIAICDNDVITCRRIKKLLQEKDVEYTIDVYSSGEVFIKSEKEYDVTFLGIEMKPIDGLETAKILRNRDREDYIIFLTNHMEYMPDAFKVRAFRFLNKSIQIPKFTEAITEAITEAEKDILKNEKFVVSSREGKVLIEQKDIVYIEALGDGTCIYTINEKFVTNKYLKYWEETLDNSQFSKIHKSYLVGLRYVQEITESDVAIIFDDISLPVARRRRKEFEMAYAQYEKEYNCSVPS